jgi:xylulokinase
VLDQLDLIPFRSVDKRYDAPTSGFRWSIGKWVPFRCGVFCEFFDAVDLKRKMRNVGTDIDRTAPLELADFNLFIAPRSLEENELRTTRRFRAVRLLKTEHILVKMDRFFQIRNPIAGVKKLGNHRLKTATNEPRRPSTSNNIRNALNIGICEAALICGSLIVRMLYIGIDSGTQSTKSIVVDLESGGILATSQQNYELIPGLPDGHMEQNPAVWIDAVDKTIQDCLKQLGDRKNEIRAIGVSGQQHGLVVLNSSAKVIRPAKLWCDTSTSAQCKEIIDEFGGESALIKLIGNTMLPGWTAPKILWLKQNEPENFASVNSILLPHDYINFWLTGERRMEYGDASGTGLLDVRTRQWCEPIIDFIDEGLPQRLPPVGSSRQAVGLLRENLRTKWGLKSSPVVSAGGGDNMMGAIGTGNVRPGMVTASLGTSGTIYAYSLEPIVDPQGEMAAFCDSTDKWLPLVCTMNVTVATEQVRKIFGWDVKKLDASVAEASPGAGGIIFLPYLVGERTPNLPHGVGVYHGLTATNMTPANLARAAMEGATMGLAYGLSRLRSLGIKVSEIRLTGGGSKSRTWRQICADIFRTPVVCLATAEGAALGAAMHGAWVDHLVNNKPANLVQLLDKVVQLDESSRALPDSETAALYQEAFTRFKGLTQRLSSGGFL